MTQLLLLFWKKCSILKTAKFFCLRRYEGETLTCFATSLYIDIEINEGYSDYGIGVAMALDRPPCLPFLPDGTESDCNFELNFCTNLGYCGTPPFPFSAGTINVAVQAVPPNGYEGGFVCFKTPCSIDTDAPSALPSSAPSPAPTKAPVKAPITPPTKAPVKSPVVAPAVAPAPTPSPGFNPLAFLLGLLSTVVSAVAGIITALLFGAVADESTGEVAADAGADRLAF